MSYPIVEKAFEEFSEVGKTSVLIELKIRLLANKIKGLEKYAHEHKISETELALFPYLIEQNLLTKEEKHHLEQSRKIRNKIFHCEFDEAVKLIEQLAPQSLASGFVIGAKINELEGENILDKLLRASESITAGRPVKGLFKVGSTTIEEAGIFGWLIEAFGNGVLSQGKQIANASLAVLDRIFVEIGNRELGGKE